MEVKPGFIQTEVGIVPEDWMIFPITSLLENGTRITYGVVQPGCNDANGVLFIRGGDVFGGRVLYEQLRRIPVEVSNKFARTRLQGGEILVSLVGYPGEVAIVPTWLAGANIARQVALVRVARHSPVRRDYLATFLLGPTGRRALLKEAIGSAQQVINLRDINSVKVASPETYEEQEAIAEALSDADALIESLERLIAKKRQIKQGAMQELLTGQRRLPGFHGEWEMKLLRDLGTFLKGSGVTKSQTFSGDIPCVRYGEIYSRHNDYVRAFSSWISREVAQTATRLKRGDILFAGSGETKEEIGKSVAFIDEIEAYAGGDIVILRTEGADPLFLGYYLNTSEIARQKASRGQGDAVVHISASALGAIQGKFPKLEEQQSIAEVLSEMDSEIAALETKLSKARQFKQGMMQELLTGRIRLV